MGIFDSLQGQGQQPQQGGVFAGLGQAGAAPSAPASGAMPPEMMALVQKIKQADPDSQRQMMQGLIQHLQASGKQPQEVQAAIQQLISAVQG